MFYEWFAPRRTTRGYSRSKSSLLLSAFKKLCAEAKGELGALTIKLCSSKAKYSGIIVYAVNMKFQWQNDGGVTKGSSAAPRYW